MSRAGDTPHSDVRKGKFHFLPLSKTVTFIHFSALLTRVISPKVPPLQTTHGGRGFQRSAGSCQEPGELLHWDTLKFGLFVFRVSFLFPTAAPLRC